MKIFSKIAPSTKDQPGVHAPKAPGGRGYTVGWLPQLEQDQRHLGCAQAFGGDAPKNPVTKSVAQCPGGARFRQQVISSSTRRSTCSFRLSVTNGELGITNLLFDKSPMRPERPAADSRVPAAARMAASGPARNADADVLRLRFGRSGVRQSISRRSSITARRSGPGVQINGRFPIDIWPRSLQWASNGTICPRT